MKKLISLVLFVAIVLLFTIILFKADILLAQINPTAQQQTVDAVVQQLLKQTQTAQAVTPTNTRISQTATPLPATQTALFEAVIQESLNKALTSTADAQPKATEVVIVGKLVSGQTANVRKCPATTCEVVGTVSPANEFSILLRDVEWYFIEFAEGEFGYIYAPLVAVPENVDWDNLPTLTPSPTPSRTPTATPDVSLTATASALGDLIKPKSDGFYLVGVDIYPGRWESTGRSSGCYWARKDSSGELIANSFGMAGGTVTVLETDYEIEFSDCGQFIYVENLERELQPDAYEPKSSGYYTVGVEIAPGRWRSNGRGESCYWARLNRFQDIIDNHFGNAGGTVYINPNDYEVEFSNCGEFEYLNP